MSLIDVKLEIESEQAPRDVRLFLREAQRRIDSFQRHSHVPGFVPSDFGGAYRVLRALAAHLRRGSFLCEWGSGFGVVACLAAMLEFDVCAIEIEQQLVDAAQRLADDFGVPVQFACGSFIPRKSQFSLDDDFAWLSTEGADGHEQLGQTPDEFDVIFAYPWPDEEALTGKLFQRYAAAGAVLVTYHGADFRVRRKRR